MGATRRAVSAVLCLVVLFILGTGPAGGATQLVGERLWAKRFDGPTKGHDNAQALAVSPDGSRVFVTGESFGSSEDDYATVAYDASTGARLWAKRYDGLAGKRDSGRALAVSPDGSSVFVTGFSEGTASSWDYATVAYDASSGALLWVNLYNGPGNSYDVAHGLAVAPDGSKVFVTGESRGSRGYPDYATVAYASATGARLWVKRYNGPHRSDIAHALAVSADGSEVFVTGQSMSSTTSWDYATVAYASATGARLWVKRYNGPGNGWDSASALALSPDGFQVFVTGESPGSTGYSDYATVAYDSSSGSRLWVRRYDGPGHGSDYAYALAVNPDGSRVFVTGHSEGTTSFVDYATLAYDALTGVRLWTNRYTGPGNQTDVALAMALRPDGSNVFVTGYSQGATGGLDYATVAYDAFSGASLWAKRYNGMANESDYAHALGVSPDGSRVFVTGQSQGSADFYDYATVAYSAT